MNELPQERLIIAVVAQAACEWMFEETRAYVKQRKAFGKTISNLQVWPVVGFWSFGNFFRTYNHLCTHLIDYCNFCIKVII